MLQVERDMLKPLVWLSEWRSGKAEAFKLNTEAMPFKNDFLSEGEFVRGPSSITTSTNLTSPRITGGQGALYTLKLGWDHFISCPGATGSRICTVEASSDGVPLWCSFLLWILLPTAPPLRT